MESTRLTFRLPADLAAELTAQAQACGVSLNAWLVLAARNWTAYKRREFGALASQPVDHRRRLTPAKAASREKPKASRPAASPAAPAFPKVGRNEPCPCGSGLKFKHCHGKT